MQTSRSVIAISAWIFLAALVWGSAQAAPVGQVSNLSGPLFALAADGARRVLSVGSQVEAGETLVTEEKTYAQIRFIDKGVVTLRPGTQFKIESFAFAEQQPEKDGAVFSLLKGGLRKLTGLVGNRGNQDAYKLMTPTATIGIRGTHFLVQYVPDTSTTISKAPYALPLLAVLDSKWIMASGSGQMTDVPVGYLPPLESLPLQVAQAGLPGGLAPGTYLQVLAGFVSMSNAGGSQLFSAGQFGLAGFNIPPVVLPQDPGIGSGFTPPPSFQTTQNQAQQGPAGQSPPPTQQQSSSQDGCVVRP